MMYQGEGIDEEGATTVGLDEHWGRPTPDAARGGGGGARACCACMRLLLWRPSPPPRDDDFAWIEWIGTGHAGFRCGYDRIQGDEEVNSGGGFGGRREA
jgi:hypothetical protein